MSKKRLQSAVLAAIMTVGVTGLATPTASANDNDPVRNVAQQAFDFWAPKLYQSSPTFTLPEVSGKVTIKWVLPVTDNQDLLQAASDASEDFRTKLENPPQLRDLTKGVSELTPAIADDGTLVTVLPFDQATVSNGAVELSKLVSGVMVQATQDQNSQVPIGAPSSAIRLLYNIVSGGQERTSGFDMIDSASPSVSVNGLEVAYDNGKPDGDPFLPITNMTITPINPDTMNRVRETVRVSNSLPEDVRSVVEVLRTPTGDEQGDPSKGGLVPATDSNGKPITEEQTVGQGKATVEHTIEFKAPGEGGQIYINHRIVDAEGRDIVQPDMRTLSAMKPALDVQASSQEGSRKLAGHEKQTIYNQARISQLTPGKPYQVLVNLSQCNPTDGCTEVAAVNREIIPQDTTVRTENFAVDIDATKVADDNTYEWSTAVYAGTGDVKKMGAKLVAVDNHPSAQVLSFSGSGDSLNKTSAGDRTVQHAGKTEGLTIKNEAPPASMEKVRENNANLDAQHEDSSPWTWVAGIAGAFVVLALAVTAVYRLRFANRRRKA